MRVVGYIRLSVDSNGNGHSLDSQREAIAQWSKANEHDLVTVVVEVMSAKAPEKLAGRKVAIATVMSGMAEAVVIRDLDRVTRSTWDGAQLLQDARDNGWTLLGVVDGLDTSDPEQELATNIRIAVAQEERRKLARRTKAGLATASRKRKAEGLAPLGKPRQVKPEVERRIVRLGKQGLTPYAIAKRLTDDGTPTPQGGKAWAPSVVRDVLQRSKEPVA